MNLDKLMMALLSLFYATHDASCSSVRPSIATMKCDLYGKHVQKKEEEKIHYAVTYTISKANQTF